MKFVDGEPDFFAEIIMRIIDWFDKHFRKKKPQKVNPELMRFLKSKGFTFEDDDLSFSYVNKEND